MFLLRSCACVTSGFGIRLFSAALSERQLNLTLPYFVRVLTAQTRPKGLHDKSRLLRIL